MSYVLLKYEDGGFLAVWKNHSEQFKNKTKFGVCRVILVEILKARKVTLNLELNEKCVH